MSEYSQSSSESSSMDDGYSNDTSLNNADGADGANGGSTGDSYADLPEGALLTMAREMPIMLTIAILIYFIIAPIVMLKPTSLKSGSGFLANQMLINSSLLVTFAIVYGMLTMFFSKSIIATHQNILLPLILIMSLWIKSFLTYKNNLTYYCLEENGHGKYSEGSVPYRWQEVIWNTSKMPIAIFVTYIFIVLFPQSVTPFNQFFCGEDPPHPLVIFFSIGFWTGCATWAAEASCYFSLLQNGCQPAEKVNFESIDQVIREHDKTDDD